MKNKLVRRRRPNLVELIFQQVVPEVLDLPSEGATECLKKLAHPNVGGERALRLTRPPGEIKSMHMQDRQTDCRLGREHGLTPRRHHRQARESSVL